MGHTSRLYTSIRGTQRQFSAKYLFGEANIYLEFSIAWGWLKIFNWSFPSCTILYAYLLLYDFVKFHVSHFTAQIRLFFLQKRKPKIFRLESVMKKYPHFRQLDNSTMSTSWTLHLDNSTSWNLDNLKLLTWKVDKSTTCMALGRLRREEKHDVTKIKICEIRGWLRHIQKAQDKKSPLAKN